MNFRARFLGPLFKYKVTQNKIALSLSHLLVNMIQLVTSKSHFRF